MPRKKSRQASGSRETLILTSNNVKKLIDIRKVIEIIEKAFAAHGRGSVQMPAKIYIHLNDYNGDFRAMPAYMKDPEACGIKWVNVHPGNKLRGLPSVMALIVLNDPRSGAPLAILDGTYITNLRTGAAGAVAAKYLAKRSSSRVGLVGCGVQAFYQMMALNCAFTIKSVCLYDNYKSQARQLSQKMRSLGLQSKICATIQECVSDKDIVITTTPSRDPIVRASWISPGTHINAIGADAKGKEELEAKLLRRATVVVDDLEQACHSGEINVPISRRTYAPARIHATLGRVITGKRRGRSSRDEITIFDSTGLAVQDLAVAEYVYKRAKTLTKRDRGIKRVSFL